jgi:hypothetical protein
MAVNHKSAFTSTFIARIEELAKVMDQINAMTEEYFDNGYNSGGADEIVDGDLTDFAITATELGNGITLFQQLDNFFGNSAVSTGDYRATVNMLRRGRGQTT